jgi:glyoxylase-like metal-dependent hydrolase (beta-lactamase superfamily II)
MQKALVHIPTLIGTFEANGFHVAQFKTPELVIFSYYIESRGKALLIDPPVDIESLVNYAQTRKAVIEGILHTHFHADFIAGNLAENVSIYLG